MYRKFNMARSKGNKARILNLSKATPKARAKPRGNHVPAAIPKCILPPDPPKMYPFLFPSPFHHSISKTRTTTKVFDHFQKKREKKAKSKVDLLTQQKNGLIQLANSLSLRLESAQTAFKDFIVATNAKLKMLAERELENQMESHCEIKKLDSDPSTTK